MESASRFLHRCLGLRKFSMFRTAASWSSAANSTPTIRRKGYSDAIRSIRPLSGSKVGEDEVLDLRQAMEKPAAERYRGRLILQPILPILAFYGELGGFLRAAGVDAMPGIKTQVLSNLRADTHRRPNGFGRCKDTVFPKRAEQLRQVRLKAH